MSARRCYESVYGKDDGACDQPARYIAELNWTNGPMLLCEAHAQDARAMDDVVSIRTLRGAGVVTTRPSTTDAATADA